MVTETTPTIVAPTGIADVEFVDEADAVNHWVPILQKKGIEAIGVLMHEGGAATGPPPRFDPNGCDQLEGPVLDINDRIDPAVDLLVTAYSHQAYNRPLPVSGGEPRLVTQAGFYGRLVTDIRLTLDADTGDVDRSATYGATNVPVTREALDLGGGRRSSTPGTPARPRPATSSSAKVTGDLLRARNAAGEPVRDDESVLGTFVATAQLAGALAVPDLGDPLVAFMNPGALRTDILFAGSAAGGGRAAFRELFDVQPRQHRQHGDPDRRRYQGGPRAQFPSARPTTLLLSTSDGFTYEYDPARAEGDRVFACSISIGGETVDPAATYRIAGNSSCSPEAMPSPPSPQVPIRSPDRWMWTPRSPT